MVGLSLQWIPCLPDTRLAKALAQEVPSAFPKRCREAVEDLLEKANEPRTIRVILEDA